MTPGAPIGDFCGDDVAAVVALENLELPPPRHRTAADWLRDLAPKRDQVPLRLVAGSPAIGFVEAVDFAGIPRERARCRLTLLVAPEHRRRGIGTALYERALAFASERRAAALQARFVQPAEEGTGSAFLRRRGLEELPGERRLTSHLDLGTFDATRFASSMRRVERLGVRVAACEDLPDTPEHRRLLYDLLRATEMLGGGVQYETWSAAPERWEWARRALVVADATGAGGGWVGFTQVAPHSPAAGVWRTAHAATVPAWRNRGVGTALKLRSIELLRRRGCRVMLTANRLDNAPILAINRKLGYVPGPLELTFVKRLRGVR